MSYLLLDAAVAAGRATSRRLLYPAFRGRSTSSSASKPRARRRLGAAARDLRGPLRSSIFSGPPDRENDTCAIAARDDRSGV